MAGTTSIRPITKCCERCKTVTTMTAGRPPDEIVMGVEAAAPPRSSLECFSLMSRAFSSGAFDRREKIVLRLRMTRRMSLRQMERFVGVTYGHIRNIEAGAVRKWRSRFCWRCGGAMHVVMATPGERREKAGTNMWMADYSNAVRRALRDKHGFVPTGGTDDCPLFDEVPDGTYPVEIEGRIDDIKVVDGHISCCNFRKGEVRQ